MFDVVSGLMSDCVTLTNTGLFVGAVRHGGYFCSNDIEVSTLDAIEGLLRAEYQPCITELSDGRLLCVWHEGGGDVTCTSGLTLSGSGELLTVDKDLLGA